MAKNEKSGFQSSAGLIRYFDSEDERSLKFSPYMVMGFALATIILVTVSSYIWPT
ncbi:MAG TPA: preprotein translocase subunit Sec61beta [Methanomassiliicoccales archaeon]|nr:preprotein translocase subunit Sec61beta [Methanomassiliicoccales archaeon]